MDWKVDVAGEDHHRGGLELAREPDNDGHQRVVTYVKDAEVVKLFATHEEERVEEVEVARQQCQLP